MLQNTTLIRFIVDLGRLICIWLQVNILKEANLVSYNTSPLQLRRIKDLFYLLFFHVIQKKCYSSQYLSGLVEFYFVPEQDNIMEVRLSNEFSGTVVLHLVQTET